MEYIIDATDKTLGRLASNAANILMGKNNPNFERNVVSENKVKLINASKAKIDLKKLKSKNYLRYSGYPGGLKSERMEEVIKKKGYKEIFEMAIYGMLPANRLRKIVMKNLFISE